MKRLAAQSALLLVLLVLCLAPPVLGQEEDEGDDPGRAVDFFLFKRSPDGETFPVDKYVEALEHMKAMPRHVTSSGQTLSPSAAAAAPAAVLQTWTPLGPGNIGGRTRALLVDPVEPQTMYAAGVAGGVWKTTDGGASWRPMSDLLPSIAVVSMAMDPGNRNVIYAGTGEFFTGDGVRGGGIFKTTDGAVTWTRLAATDNPDFYYVNRVVVSSSNSARVYAATSTGVFRSLDGGATWLKILDDTAGGGCMDLVIRTDVPDDYLFAACGIFSTGTIWRATSGATVAVGGWQSVLAEAGMARTSLAIAPSDQRVVYALAAHNGSEFNSAVHAVFRSSASGDPGSWAATIRQTADYDPIGRSILSDNVLALPGCAVNGQQFWRNQGWYDNAITVDPLDPNRVWAGGINLFRSDDGGHTWGIASYWFRNDHLFAHADHHRIVFHPQYDGAANQTMFVGNDGGIYRTLNARATIGTCSAPFNGTIA